MWRVERMGWERGEGLKVGGGFEVEGVEGG